MKNLSRIIIPLLILMASSQKIEAQITLEHALDSTYGDLFYCTDIGGNDFKYVKLNTTMNSFSLYNMDMSPYLMNVIIPVTDDSIIQGFTVIYITKTLFDCDSSNIEYVYEYQYGLQHAFRIFRTDGTLLLQIDSANGPYGFGLFGGAHDVRPIINTNAGTKLFIQKYDSNKVAEVLVYALCGNLPATVFDFPERASFVKIYPNPTEKVLNFEVTFPNNLDVFDLVIRDAKGAEQKRVDVASNRKFNLDVGSLSSGTYFYSLITKNKVYQTGKFVLKK